MSKQRYTQRDSGLLLPFPDVWVPRDPRRDRRRVDSRRWMPGYPCCCEECYVCLGREHPTEWLVSITGSPNNPPYCSSVDGDWVVGTRGECYEPFIGEYRITWSGQWERYNDNGEVYCGYAMGPNICVCVDYSPRRPSWSRALTVNINMVLGAGCACGGFGITVQFRQTSTPDPIQPYECTAITAQSIPFDAAYNCYDHCDWSQAVCELTAL